jgi:hypothetical protein
MSAKNGTLPKESPLPVNRVAGTPPLDTVGDGAPGTAAPPAPAGRTAGGTFAKGNTCGRGNPFARRQAALRTELLNTVTPERLKALAERLYQRALVGDMTAASLLLSYAVGKPAKAPDPDRLDLDEWTLTQEAPTKAEINRAILFDVPPALAAAAVQLIYRVLPADPLELAQKLCDEHGHLRATQMLDEIKAKRNRRK